jgi:hypothetical protein
MAWEEWIMPLISAKIPVELPHLSQAQLVAAESQWGKDLLSLPACPRRK